MATSLADTTITANCASPGFVRTGLARDATGLFALFIRLAAPFQSPPETAATTLVHLATAPEMSGQTGGYYRKSRRAEPGGLADDPQAAARLWQISAELTETTDASSQ